MKKQLTILALATAGLLAATQPLRAEDPVPPTPPVNPPAGKPEAAARPERGPEAPEAPGSQRGDRFPLLKGDRLAMMKETLDLTPEQVEKLKPVFARQMETLKALREDAALTPEAKREKMRGIVEAAMGEVRAILTPEQIEKWKAAMKKRMPERDKRRAGQDA